jgi:cyclic pyranopterin monophosphate synthase
MVDVGDKTATRRVATARAMVTLPDGIMDALDGDELVSKKGPVFATAIVAGTMAAKQTSSLIPFCHPLAIENVDIAIEPVGADCIRIDCTVSVHSKTGVEMEALTGASVASLTVYDMCKALSHRIEIERVHLIHKSGGNSDYQK